MGNNSLLIKDFGKWLKSMDGGCHNIETEVRASIVVKSPRKIKVGRKQDAKKVCDYFVNLNGLCAASLSI